MQEIAQQRKQRISIHALLAESDDKRFKAQMRDFLFLSTLSLRRATIEDEMILEGQIEISIHALLAESDMFTGILPHHTRISIHALLAESDEIL